MPVEHVDLKPFMSVTVLRRSMDAGPRVNDLLESLADLFELRVGPRSVARLALAKSFSGLQAGFIHYRNTARPSWTINPTVTDTTNHLVVVARRADLFAVLMSEAGLQTKLARATEVPGGTLSNVSLVAPEILNAAFVEGSARTLWLSGAHRRTPIRADTKVLSGLDLRDALDPLGDQSYFFTAARSTPAIPNLVGPIGVAPYRSGVWVGPVRDWSEFVATLTSLLDRISTTTTGTNAPLPVVAIPVTSQVGVTDAYDVALLPPELTSGVLLPPDRRELVERWAYSAAFHVVAASGSDLTAEVRLGGRLLGRIALEVDLTDPGRVRATATPLPATPQEQVLLDEAAILCENREWLKVWYESGHTLGEGRIFQVRHRHLPFTGFEWGNFDHFRVELEKPTPTDAVGSQSSLFCWIQRFWPFVDASSAGNGWLACDDGPGEIADFVHLSANPRVLTLLHAKAAHSASAQRGIAVSPYEVVTAQAIKNLRALDREIVASGLSAGVSRVAGNLVWHDGNVSSRADFLSQLASWGTDYARRVVIVQPHLTRSAHDLARSSQQSGTRLRLEQLDTLLIAAQGSCRSLSADLTVVGDDV